MRRGDDLTAYVEHFRARVLQDALIEATSAYWLRRAEAFAQVGNAECDVIATACRHKAELALLDDLGTPDHLICEMCGTPTSPWSCSCGETRLGVVA